MNSVIGVGSKSFTYTPNRAMRFLDKDDYRDLCRYGERQLGRLRDRARLKGVSLQNIYHLGWILVKPTDPLRFNLHYLAIARNGQLVLFNHTKEDIACQITEWYMSNYSWQYTCHCIRLLLFLRYGKHGLWPALPQASPRLIDQKTKTILVELQQRGIERIRRRPSFCQWGKDNSTIYAWKENDPLFWLADCHLEIYHAFRALR